MEKYGLLFEKLQEEKDYSGYIRIPKECVEDINVLLRGVPELVLNNQSDLYKVVYDKSKGVLQRTAGGKAYRANIVEAGGGNNDIVGQAVLQNADKAPQIVSGFFNVMSIATGQYFLSEINGNLEGIEISVNNIQQFLENDKKSQLTARNTFLQQTQANMDIIQQNPYQKQAQITNIQSIRIDTMGDFEFYRSQLFDIIEDLQNDLKHEEIIKRINQAGEYLPLLWYSLYLYGFSYFMEIVLSGITDEDFIKGVREHLNEYIEEYQRIVDLCDVEIREQINDAAAYKENSLAFLAGKEVAAVIGWTTMGRIGSKAYKGVVDGVQTYRENMHKEQKQEGQQLFGDYMNACKDLMPAKEIIKELDVYNAIHNGPVELICTKDGGYMKICDDRG